MYRHLNVSFTIYQFLFINMWLHWITGNTGAATSWYSNPVWILGLRLILCFAGLEVKVEAVPRECPICSVEAPLTALRRSIYWD